MAYGTCETYNLPSLRTFEQARDFFNSTKPLRGDGMAKNERPMHPKRGGAYKKFRVGEVDVDGRTAYDLIFYDTNCIRYYEPNPDGTRHVVINYYTSTSTREFMWRHGWCGGSKTMQTTQGTQAFIPFCHAKRGYPSAFLTLDRNNRLIVSRSWHAPVCKYFSSDEDKQLRKDFKRVLGTVFDLLYVQEHEIRAQTLHNATKWGWHYSSARREAADDIERYVDAALYNPDTDYALSPNTIETLIEETAIALRNKAQNFAYKEACEKFKGYGSWTDRKDFQEKRIPELIQTMDMKIPITEARNSFLELCGYMGKNKHVQLPMFLSEPPKGRFFHDVKGEHFHEGHLLRKYKNV